MSSLTNTVICPACGAIIESQSEGELVALTREHTEAAHGYSVPAEHVVQAISRDDHMH
jgi:predicted small metal-binding protein